MRPVISLLGVVNLKRDLFDLEQIGPGACAFLPLPHSGFSLRICKACARGDDAPFFILDSDDGAKPKIEGLHLVVASRLFRWR
jgi:hypothetical protein